MFGMEKWLSDGERSFIIYSAVSDTIPACDRQTDGRTDGQTSYHGIVHAYAEHRAVMTQHLHKTRHIGTQLLRTSHFVCLIVGVLFRK